MYINNSIYFADMSSPNKKESDFHNPFDDVRKFTHNNLNISYLVIRHAWESFAIAAKDCDI